MRSENISLLWWTRLAERFGLSLSMDEWRLNHEKPSQMLSLLAEKCRHGVDEEINEEPSEP